MGRILAVDYGTKRVGLAVTDPLQIIASPLTTVKEPDAVTYIGKYLRKEEVDAIVVGMPYNLSGEATDATQDVIKFISRLTRLFPTIEIKTEDEQFTSKMAVSAMVAAGIKKKDRRKKENIDKISASLILQAYLESVERST